jgi:uncharacterized membrane protein (UPF0127 family)
MFKARSKSYFFTFLLGLALAVSSQLANAAPFEKGYALVGDHLLEVELAATSTQRQIGLSNRGLEKKYYFMVFIFDTPEKVSFWMKDTKIDLSLALIDSNNKVNQIISLKANSLKRNSSKSNDIKYVLEVPKGYLTQNEIGVGDNFQLFK